MNYQPKKIFILIICLCLSFGNTYAQGAKKEATIRDGAKQSAIQELKINNNIELTKNYVKLFDCANYKPIGLCIKPGLPPKFRLMMQYYVPFELTDSSNRPDGTMAIERNQMKQVLERAFKAIDQGRSQYLKAGHENIKNQQGETLSFTGETEDKIYQALEDYHNKEQSFMGILATLITQNGNVFSNHEWHNEMRDKKPFSEEENPFGWCHTYSKWAFNGKKEEHPEIDPFTSLGVLNPKNQKQQLIPLIAVFQEASRNKQLFEDLEKRTPERGKPVDFACYEKKHQNQIGHPKTFGSDDGPELVPKELQGDEQSDEICPGKGFLGAAGPFWILAKSYFPAGNALMGSLRGLVVAWNTIVENPDQINTVDTETGKHKPYLKDENGFDHNHMQLLWPKEMEGWPHTCGDTKDKDAYINPDWRHEDMGKANVWKDENFGHYYIMASYTSIVCCPEGWIPITYKRLKDG